MTDRDRDEAFQQVLASFLRDDLAPAGLACLAPGAAAAYYAGALSEPEARAVEAHLAGCAACQAEIALLARLEASGIGESETSAAVPRLAQSTDKGVVSVAPYELTHEEARSANELRRSAGVAPPPEPSAIAEAEPASEGALTNEPEPVSLRHQTEWFPRRRRMRWTWMGAAALSAAAVLAISVTYRFTPLIDEASRRASDTDSLAARTATGAAKSKDAEEYIAAPPPPPEAQPAPTAAPFFSDEPSENKADVTKESALPPAAGEAASTSRQEPERAGAPSALPSPESQGAADRVAGVANQRSLSMAKEEASRAGAAPPVSPTSIAPAAAAQTALGARPVVVVARSNLDVTWRLKGTTIERSDDAGKTWHGQPVPTESPLFAGSAPSDGLCWAAGANGTVLRTSDGRTWERLPSPTNDDIVQIIAWSVLNASIRTVSGERFSTNDGGQTWSKP